MLAHNFPPTALRSTVVSRLLLQYQSLKELVSYRYRAFRAGDKANFVYSNINAQRFSLDASKNAYTLLTHVGAPEVVLIDQEGSPVHRWYYDPHRLFPDRKGMKLVVRHAELLSDGTLLCIYEAPSTTPYGVGMACFDKNSNLLWKQSLNIHHSLVQSPQKEIYALFHDLITLKNRQILEDGILQLSPSGDIKSKKSISDMFRYSDYKNFISEPNYDYLHGNSLSFIQKTIRLGTTTIHPGDLLLSLRNISVIAIIDQTSLTVKWAIKNYTNMQHSPEQLKNGNILVYDNLGNLNPYRSSSAISRVIEFDPVSLKTTWQYLGSVNSPLFVTPTGSNSQGLANGNVLICLDQKGIIEVSRDKRVLWRLDFPVLYAKRYPASELSFLGGI
ncbi:MAG: arylsulfotransferase family protein [bacterium]